MSIHPTHVSSAPSADLPLGDDALSRQSFRGVGVDPSQCGVRTFRASDRYMPLEAEFMPSRGRSFEPTAAQLAYGPKNSLMADTSICSGRPKLPASQHEPVEPYPYSKISVLDWRSADGDSA